MHMYLCLKAGLAANALSLPGRLYLQVPSSPCYPGFAYYIFGVPPSMNATVGVQAKNANSKLMQAELAVR